MIEGITGIILGVLLLIRCASLLLQVLRRRKLSTSNDSRDIVPHFRHLDFPNHYENV